MSVYLQGVHMFEWITGRDRVELGSGCGHSLEVVYRNCSLYLRVNSGGAAGGQVGQWRSAVVSLSLSAVTQNHVMFALFRLCSRWRRGW